MFFPYMIRETTLNLFGLRRKEEEKQDPKFTESLQNLSNNVRNRINDINRDKLPENVQTMNWFGSPSDPKETTSTVAIYKPAPKEKERHWYSWYTDYLEDEKNSATGIWDTLTAPARQIADSLKSVGDGAGKAAESFKWVFASVAAVGGIILIVMIRSALR